MSTNYEAPTLHVYIITKTNGLLLLGEIFYVCSENHPKNTQNTSLGSSELLIVKQMVHTVTSVAVQVPLWPPFL
jgi:hypothetical protein